MKKANLSSLALNRKAITNLNATNVTGGFETQYTCSNDSTATAAHCTPSWTGMCGGSTNCSTWDGCVTPTNEQNCGLETIDLSWCADNGGYLPDPCLSTGVCA
ncbi:MAG: hypothetical protein ACOYXT_28065 [Bacteroidota bacterium]